jgi:hypothetical protein
MSKASKYRTNADPHPLEASVLAIFRDHPAQDAGTLAPAMAGCTYFPGRPAGMKAYRVVAEDVLGYMLDQGKLFRDEHGWYRVVGAPQETRS